MLGCLFAIVTTNYMGYHPLAILYDAPRLYPDLLDKVVGPITDCTLAIKRGHAGRQKAELRSVSGMVGAAV